MSNDISDTKTLMRVELKHACKEILELFRVEAFWLALRIGVSLPEEVRSVSGKKLVIVIFFVGHSEGRVTGVQDEENYSEGEEINNLSLIRLSRENLRCHVSRSTDDRFVGARSVTSFKRACKTEIDNLNIVHFVKENILRLEISMREALGVDVVNTLKHLLEEILADVFLEGA